MPKRISRRAIKPAKLAVLWSRFSDFKRGQLTANTMRDFAKTGELINKLPKGLTSAIEIRDWMMEVPAGKDKPRYANERVRRVMVSLNACCTWAYNSELINQNPFSGLSKEIRKTSHVENQWTAFAPDERLAIIDRFEKQNPYYAPWVKFLFWTGCRPSEAAALTWEQIKPDLSAIHFVRAAQPGMVIQPTKTRKDRFFPVNDRLRFFLLGLRPEPMDRSQILLPGEKGGRMEFHNFGTRHWKPLIEEMVQEGLVFRYMGQYHCRHTWITMALEAGMDVNDIAYLSGNSPNIIYRHYASRNRNIKVPEF